LYICFVWKLRKDRDELYAKYDPVKDCIFLSTSGTYVEEPLMVRVALEFAIFRTFGVESVSKLLHATGQFKSHFTKRFEDTDILLREVSERINFDHERSQQAFKRINYIHSKYKITNEDMLFVLSTLVFGPEQFEPYFQLPIDNRSHDISFNFLRGVGERMGIIDIPSDYEAYKKWKDDYEDKYMKYTEVNHTLAEYSIQNLADQAVPKLLHPIYRQIVYFLMDNKLRTALGYPDPNPYFALLLHVLLYLRGRFIRYLLPPRPLSWILKRTSDSSLPNGKYFTNWKEYGIDIYPEGYVIEQLGPTKI